MVPDSKAIRLTIPGRSALTVTPWTATTVPMAERACGHVSVRATMVVTASGGGWNEAAWAMPVWICRNFTVPTVPTKTAITVSIRIIRFAMRRGLRCPYDLGNRELRTRLDDAVLN